MSYYRSTLALICVTLACTATARGASAESERVTEGRTHFTRGVEYYKDEDYRNAMVEFKRAHELAPNYKLLYNLSQTAQELKDYAFALKSLERYLAEGGNDIAAERRAEVTSTIKKLKQRVAEVTLKSNTSSAEVLVDDVPAGRTPLSSALIVSAGRRTITVTKGSQTATRTIEVAGGERAELSLDLASAEPHAAAVPRSGEPSPVHTGHADVAKTKRPNRHESVTQAPSEPHHGSNPTWIGVVATSVFAVAAGVTGGFALAAKRDFDGTLDRYPITPGDVADARDKTRKLSLATDILAGAAVLSCGVTVWMAVANGKSDTRTSARIGIALTPRGLAAEGRF